MINAECPKQRFYGSYTINYVILMCANILIISSCQINTHNTADFLSRFAHDDFHLFAETTLFVRGTDQQGNIFLVVSDSRIDSTCQVPTPLLFISVGKGSYAVKNIANNFEGACGPLPTDKQLEQLAYTFFKYKVNYIHVDKNGDVFVGFGQKNFMQPDLIRTNHFGALAQFLQDDFVPLNATWYERVRAD